MSKQRGSIETFDVHGWELVGRQQGVIRAGNVRRNVIKNEAGVTSRTFLVERREG